MKETIHNAFDTLTLEETDRLLEHCPETPVAPPVRRRIRRSVLRRVRAERAEVAAPLSGRPPLRRKLIAGAVASLAVVGAITVIGLPEAAAAAAEGLQLVAEGVKDTVATVRRLFTYVPGEGITEVTVLEDGGDPTDPNAPLTPVDFTYLAFKTGNEYIPATDGSSRTARLSRAMYKDGRLYVNIECSDCEVAREAFALSINGVAIDPADEGLTVQADVYKGTSYSEGEEPKHHTDTYATVSYVMELPTESKTIEITVDGYEGILTTTSMFYSTFEEISALGPTVEKNGIALTVNTEWKGDDLAVWITPFITDPENTDTLLHYGRLGNGQDFYHYSEAANQYLSRKYWSEQSEQKHGNDVVVNNNNHNVVIGQYNGDRTDIMVERYYEEMMKCIPNIHISALDPGYRIENWQYTPITMNTVAGYDRYTLPKELTEATLTIPFLAMRRDETHTLEIPLPTEYGTVETDLCFETTLGNIRITSITRTQGTDKTEGYDEIICTLAFDGCSEKEYLYDFQYTIECDRRPGTSASGDPSTARKDDLGLWVAPDEDSMTLTITALDYFLMDDYIFDLDLTSPD